MVGKDAGGGSLTLARLIDDAGDVLIPELRKEYGISLTETLNGRGESPALVLLYVRALPGHGPTMARLGPDPDWVGWSPERHLLAGIFDVIRENTTVVSAPSYTKPIELTPWPRPGDESDAEEEVDANESPLDGLWKSLMVR